MPRLWNDTIDEHRRAVRKAVLDAAAALVAEQGLTAVTMAGVAERASIGRATLYKYFSDVQEILHAWHERQIESHLGQLTAARDSAEGPERRLRAVLSAFAGVARAEHAPDSHRHHEQERLAAELHRGTHTTHAHRRVRALLRELIDDAARAGEVRRDIPPEELTAYCLHALVAARDLDGEEAAQRLVDVTLDGLRPPSGSPSPRKHRAPADNR